MAGSNTVGPDYSKLTVPQLKARCKELSITGYSKLGKAALLEKLAQHEKSEAVVCGDVPPVVADSAEKTSLSSKSLPIVPSAISGNSLDIPSIPPTTSPLPRNLGEESLQEQTASSQPPIVLSASATVGLAISDPAKVKVKRTAFDPARANQSAMQKRPKLSGKAHITKGSENVPPSGQVSKKSNRSSLARILSGSEQTATVTRLESPPPKVLVTNDGSRLRKRLSSGRKSIPKRFRPPTPYPKSKSNQAEIEPVQSRIVSLERLLHLDFSSAPAARPPDSYVTISIPPSLAERKHVNAWSVILSGLSDAERRICALVSRAIRYAVYLSAIPIIVRDFGARRFSQLTQKYNMCMTNFWPFLRHLRHELAEQRSAYNASFLSRFFGSNIPVARTIWGCPDSDKQLTVALRFLMTRLWFAISLNQADIERARNTIVIDVQEVVKNEIWRANVLTGSSISAKDQRCSVYYVLESTCEVIGLPLTSGNPLPSKRYALTSIPHKKPFLRTDWSDYIHHRISSMKNGDEQFPLLYYLKTTNAEEYRNGISILWLKRIAEEKEVGRYKRQVAERYILACVVGNSVSGKWMSSSHMAQVFAGTASESDVIPTSLLQRESQRVNLFLPAHHLVESVHFNTNRPTQDLHPALAIVQTPSREYFILRDNGMEVGCEEDGVWPVWRDLLGCDARGVACP